MSVDLLCMGVSSVYMIHEGDSKNTQTKSLLQGLMKLKLKSRSELQKMKQPIPADIYWEPGTHIGLDAGSFQGIHINSHTCTWGKSLQITLMCIYLDC